jgi:hypothetical protein
MFVSTTHCFNTARAFNSSYITRSAHVSYRNTSTTLKYRMTVMALLLLRFAINAVTRSKHLLHFELVIRSSTYR